MKNAGTVEKESPINKAENIEKSTLVSILKVESQESSSSQLIPTINSQQFLLDYDENMGVESIPANHDAINDTLDSKPTSGVESISADIDDTVYDNDEASTASDSTKETDSEDEKKADSDDNINIINDESNLVDGTKNEN